MPTPLLQQEGFRTKVNTTMAVYHALRSQGIYGRPTNRGGRDGKNSGNILSVRDASQISRCIRQATNLGDGANWMRILSKATQFARVILQRTANPNMSQEFGIYLPVIVMAATAVYDITKRASAYAAEDAADDDSEPETMPDCIEYCFPSSRTSPGFKRHLTKWWSLYVDEADNAAYSAYSWTSACWDNDMVRGRFPNPSPPPSPPAASSSNQNNAEQRRRTSQDQQQRAAQQRAAREQQERARAAADRDRRNANRERHNAQARASRAAEEARQQQAADERRSRRTAEEAERARREREEAAAQNARREEEERERNARKQADEASRAARDRLAQELHKEDVETQKRYFDERQASPHNPPPRPPVTAHVRSVSLPPRIPEAERAFNEAKRAAEIATNIASANEKLAAATTEQSKAAAEAELDAAIADSRKFPAYPHRIDECGPESEFRPLDKLHPLAYAVTFVRIKRDQPLWATERLAAIHGGLVDAYDTARETNNEVEIDRILKLVMASVSLFLRESTRKEDSLERRFDLYDKRDLDTLIAEYLADAQEAEDKACSKLPAQQADVLARVMYLLSKGEISKAAAAVFPGAVLDTSDLDVLEQLKSRVGKERAGEMPGSLDPGDKGFKSIDIDVGKGYRRLERLKGTGPDNISPEILSAIARHFAGNPKAAAAVDLHQTIADQYLEGSLPHWFYALSSIPELVPLAKSLDSIDVRPISMTSLYARTWKALAARQACENAEIHFAKAQLGVGVSGGSVSNALGPAIYLEGADGTEVVACLDVRNAFCEMSREAACKALMNSSDENIKALAPVFHAANSASLRAKGVEVQIEEGGGQGCPLMTVVFAEVLHQAILDLKKEDGVDGVVAFLDDMTVVGAVNFVLPAVMRLAEKIEELGLELNLSKCKIIPKDATMVRSALVEMCNDEPRLSEFTLAAMPGVDTSSAEWGDGFGAVIAGTPVGDLRFIHFYMDKVTREALADARHITQMLVATSGQAALAILMQSSKTKLSHLMMTIRPTIAELYLEMYDVGLVTQFFEMTGLMVDDLTDLETELVMHRLRASRRNGGVGLNDPMSDCRQNFVNGFTMGAPRLVDRTLKGKRAEGCIPMLSSALGNKFSKGEGEQRWSKATSEESLKTSSTCLGFYMAYRGLQEEVVLDGSAPVTGVLATPVEAAGIAEGMPNGNVLKKFASLIAQQRAAVASKKADDICSRIPRESKVREAYVYSMKHSSSMTGFIATCPTYSGVIGNVHLQTAMASFLGLPIPALKEHQNIRLPHSEPQPIYLDPHGHGIFKADKIKGTATKDRHDSFLIVLADMLRTAGVRHTVEDVTAFGGARLDPQTNLPPIIPDIVIKTTDQPYLCDLKFMGTGTNLFDADKEEGAAIETRATRINDEYQTAASKHDEKWNTTNATTTLRTYGRVRGLVVGPRGELSKDLVDLIALAATAAGTKNWMELGEENASLARARYLRVFRRKIAVAAVRAQAICMSSRLEQALAQNAGGSRPSHRVRTQRWKAKKDHEEYANIHASFASTNHSARNRRG